MTTCVACGCTDAQACVDEETGEPCQWVELSEDRSEGLCSACVQLHQAAQLLEALVPWRPADRIPLEHPIGLLEESPFGGVRFVPLSELPP